MKQLTLTEQRKKRAPRVKQQLFHAVRRTVRDQRREKIYKATRVAEWYSISLTTLNDILRASSWADFEARKLATRVKRTKVETPEVEHQPIRPVRQDDEIMKVLATKDKLLFTQRDELKSKDAALTAQLEEIGRLKKVAADARHYLHVSRLVAYIALVIAVASAVSEAVRFIQ